MRTPPILALVIATAIVLSACSSPGDNPAEGGVRPFSEVQETEFSFENDPTFPGRGIFRVITTEPMICAIVRGETEDLGRFNNSLDMNGTGIADHQVFLPNAEAGVTYFYRVQGSSANGAIYQSDVMTFTLPPIEGGGSATEQTGENLALGATVVDVSSEFSASWAAGNAVDGDLATEWSSRGDGDDAFITLDLGSEQDVAGVEFLTRSIANGTAVTNTYWVTADEGDRFGPFQAGNPANPNFTPVEFRGQIIRFEIDNSTGGNTGAIEVRLFAPVDSTGGGTGG